MPWRGPAYEGEFPSLGWQVLDWAEEHFRVPDGPMAGQPLCLTDEQAAILVRFYGLDDRGRWLFRRAAVRRAQGWGKSPLLAVVALAELAGPSRFGGWDEDGEPVGVRPSAPWVQVAACSEDQTDNTYAAAYTMALESDLNGPVIDVGLTRMFLQGETGKLEPVTSAAGTRLGQRITFAVLDETHLWLPRNGGVKLAATIRRNAGKMGGRTFESTNAHLPGEDSVAERTYKAHENAAAGLLYDSAEGPPVEDLSDRDAVLGALRVAYGDASWIDLDRLADEIADPGTDPQDARRFYLNQLVAGERQAVDPILWDQMGKELEVGPGTRIGVGFDGSISDDATALIGCTAEGHVFPLRVWARPDGAKEWRVPRGEVEQAVADVFSTYDVGRMLCDPPKWGTEIERWAQTYGDEVVLFFDTNQPRRMAIACDRFATFVAEQSGSHAADPTLTAHVLAMARKKAYVRSDDGDGRTRYVFTKADTRKIDAGIGAVLALEAAMTMPAELVSASIYETRGLAST